MNSFGGSGHESAGERVDSERLMAQVQQEMANQFAQVEGPRSALGEGGGGEVVVVTMMMMMMITSHEKNERLVWREWNLPEDSVTPSVRQSPTPNSSTA